ncbi:uncharacterized protein Z518_02881 [Rhinocladiella mackenziei CBS 650.93]|uniref:DUF6536 domain-containing protein n=1 Tax=Rhinocladiella mackenziei CBS 650.93 TaxID=1442369 RepID=A0A0D2JFX4_9EURO|nr:uncharacterized protein Z518_02881 [Rhinocladiella mackenziei CBS 650.93]KIX08225.1 hypothetical protein Z518_02881 [Rhinocladiella mackenziei CBS 650.93]
MESGAKRRHIPPWPPFKQSYQQLGSTENLHLTPLPPTGGTPLSNLPSANLLSPDLNSVTTYTPDPLASTPTAFLRSPSKHAPAKKGWRRRGWRSGSRIALACAVLVLVTNIALTIGIVTTGSDMTDGIWMVYRGSCSATETKDTWVHLGLNVVATVLLASSNFCMQLLSSPSRSEVDKAHVNRKWLDIGIPSLRNLGSLRRKKVALWWLLGISSIPLHLVYNSIFYSALATNNYSVLYASQSFLQGASYDTVKFPDTEACNITDIRSRLNEFIILNNEDCIHAYAKDFVEDRRNVIVVVQNPPASEGSLFKTTENEFPAEITNAYNPFAWICDNPNVVNQTDACCENEYGFVPCSKITPKLVDMADQWSTGGFEVDHCLSEPVESECHLHFSLVLMGVVLGFNILKVIGIAYVVFRLGEPPLVTVGDAIQSFLRNPDRTSEGMCLSSHASVVASSKLGYAATTMRYEPQQHRFYESASWRQWSFLLGLFTLLGIGTSACLALGIENFKGDKTIQNAWSIGLGTVRPQNLIMGWNLPGYGNTSIAISTLIANTPQALFSFLYVCYNSLFTVMFVSRELANFSVTAGRGRKYLRVSDARGEQKSTYFLNLPYKYGIPLLVGSGLMHWLVSQAIFLANITIIPRDGLVPMQDEITTVAYSPIAMLFMLFLGFAMLLFLLLTALRKLPIGMPLIGSNSLAISAACHPPTGPDQSEREDMVLHPLSWGAVPGGAKVLDLGIRDHHAHGFEEGPDENGRGIGHCCFSDRVLEPPERGKLYA